MVPLSTDHGSIRDFPTASGVPSESAHTVAGKRVSRARTGPKDCMGLN